MAGSRLFKPVRLGTLTLQNRIAMAPLTRFRADDSHVPLPFVSQYYEQRASTPGTFLITEATLISNNEGGYANVPGIYTQDQINAWKTVTKKIHDKGSFIYLQLWALGRVADPKTAEKEGITIHSSSPTPVSEGAITPKEMTVGEIKETVQAYAQAARNAIEAGFDGVEVHGANGYLIDQFIQDTANKRTDSYGGSIENRNRFAIEVTQAVVDAVGANRTGIRLSPWSEFQGMRMQDPIPQFSDLIKKLDKFNLAYLHFVESRVSGNADVESSDSLNFAYPLFKAPILVAGGFTPESAKRLVDEEHPERDIIVVFGRSFIANPDLVFRVKNGVEFTKYNRDDFYRVKSEKGYLDYPFSQEFKEARL